jgi:hypothetical protein
MTRWLSRLALLFLAACSSGEAPSPPPGTAQAFFTAPDTIEVVVSDYYPPQTVELVGPFGQIPAASINATGTPSYAAPPVSGSFGVGVAGGGGSHTIGGAGIGLGFPIGGGAGPSSYPVQIVSTALIQLPQTLAYPTVWHSTEIRIQFGGPPGNVHSITLPAPAPPQGS